MLLKFLSRTSLCCLVLLCPHHAWTQATTSLGGRVTDGSGAIVPGANVKLTSPSTGTSRSANTSSTGDYVFSQLAPGRYELIVSSPGFATAERTSLDLLVSQPATVNVVLKVATTNSEITVSAGIQPVLNTTDATLGNAFEGQQIQDLPIEGRNVPDLLSLQPGVTFLGRTDGNTGTTSVGNTSAIHAAEPQTADVPTSPISPSTAST